MVVSNNEGKKDNKRNRNSNGSLHTFGLVDDSAEAALLPLAGAGAAGSEDDDDDGAADMAALASSVVFFCCFDAIAFL